MTLTFTYRYVLAVVGISALLLIIGVEIDARYPTKIDKPNVATFEYDSSGEVVNIWINTNYSGHVVFQDAKHWMIYRPAETRHLTIQPAQ